MTRASILRTCRDTCLKVIRYTEGMTFEQFTADDRTFDAVMRNLEITGEAAGQLSRTVQNQVPELLERVEKVLAAI